MADHTLEYEGHYVNGQLDELWKYWCDTQREINDHYTLMSESYYVDGQRNGHWVEFGPNGNITFEGESMLMELDNYKVVQ